MARSRPLRHWTIFTAVFALLLKAAVPLLASTAASLHGTAVAQVCSVYGVRLAPQAEHNADHDADPAGAHGDNHCALTALAALAPHAVNDLALPAAATQAEPRLPAVSSFHDAAALWAARMWHPPPAEAQPPRPRLTAFSRTAASPRY